MPATSGTFRLTMGDARDGARSSGRTTSTTSQRRDGKAPADYGIKTIVDLRNDDEIGASQPLARLR